ncbi:MAG TPA: FkbM family methyltransferase [Victivallales bacterium]|nr:FkbM family methyltransferase [Victivallales bacterium]
MNKEEALRFGHSRIGEYVIYIYRKIFARKCFIFVNRTLFHLSLRGLGVLNFSIKNTSKVSGELYFIKNILPKFITPIKPIIFDIGANEGDYTKDIINNFPRVDIFAFEPHPKTFSRLKINTASDNVNLYNLAMGDTQSKMTLYDIEGDGSVGATLHSKVLTELYKKDITSYEVNVETLDNFVAKAKINEIDLLKIDVEGNELAILKGASKLLKSNKIKCIHFEFNEMNVISRTFSRDIRNTLVDYNLYRLLPNGLINLDDLFTIEKELFGYQNIIALPKSFSVKF